MIEESEVGKMIFKEYYLDDKPKERGEKLLASPPYLLHSTSLYCASASAASASAASCARNALEAKAACSISSVTRNNHN